MTTRTKEALAGTLIRWLIIMTCATPVIASLILAVLAYTYYAWEWRCFVIFLAGALWTVAHVIAFCWAWEECKLGQWIDSLDFDTTERKGRPLYE